MKISTKLSRSFFLILALAGAAFVNAGEKIVPLDRIITIVNDDVITLSELENRIKIVRRQLDKQGTPQPPEKALEKQLLERMITDLVQYQYATQTGIRVDDAQLESTIKRIAEQNKLSMDEFRSVLKKDGINLSKFREDLRHEIILARLREREVNNRIMVTEAEIDNYLTTTKNLVGSSNEIEVAHIMIRVPEQSSPEKIQALQDKAEDALQKLQQGTDFNQVSAGYSDAPNALEGGKLGRKKMTQLPELFQEALKSMKVGELSPLLRSSNGFHILKLISNSTESAPVITEQTHARHILLKPSEILSDDEAQKRLSDLKEQIDNGASFEELARQYSQDGSASKGGDLGWINPGDTVPAFEKAMNALVPGEVSQPIRSAFGWHLIEVLERRSQDISVQNARLEARRTIKARKADEAYQSWLRELRDRAYVEYRLEDTN